MSVSIGNREPTIQRFMVPVLTITTESASSSDPNDWIVEGIKSALLELKGEGVRFHESLPVAVTTVSDDDDFDEDIPF